MQYSESYVPACVATNPKPSESKNDTDLMNCYGCCMYYQHEKSMDDAFNSPMPWVGVYIAAASLVCTLAMAADVYLGFHHKRHWFPCKYFTLNAATLALVAVAMKLTIDLANPMPGETDQLAKFSSMVFMCTIPAIWNYTDIPIYVQQPLLMVFMFVLLLILGFSALTTLATAKYINLKCANMQKIPSNEEHNQTRGLCLDKLKKNVIKYRIMAETGNPQFVMARSVVCSSSGAIRILAALLLVNANVITYLYRSGYVLYSQAMAKSNYKWSTIVILVIQSFGVGIGTIASALRWFNALKLKFSEEDRKSFKTQFKTEPYWIEMLVMWKERPIALNIDSQNCRKFVDGTKNLFLGLCIMLQIAIVVVSKSIMLMSFYLMIPVFYFFRFYKWLRWKLTSKLNAESNCSAANSEPIGEIDLSSCVLLLEGEPELSKETLMNICDATDDLIQSGRKQQPKQLMELLEKSTSFAGVTKFDSKTVPSLRSFEPSNSWMLPVVSLTSIALALPNIPHVVVKQLLRGVSEGLRYTSLIEKNLVGKQDLMNIKDAAKLVWLGIEVYGKWLDHDLRRMASKEQNSEGTLQTLSNIAKKHVMESKTEADESQMANALTWPAKVIAANYMYRITQTLLLEYELGNECTDERMFEKLSIMVADILAACLTNIPRVISMKCFCSDIKEGEKSAEKAARLLGETEEILKFVEKCPLPCLNEDQAASIDEWRAILNEENQLASTSCSHESASDEQEIC